MTPAARRILDTASELFYDRGITAVGMELVAEEAGTTKKTIYDRFGSKDGLVTAYLGERSERWQRHVLDRLAASRVRGARRVLVVVDALETWLAESRRGCGFINAYAELSPTSEQAIRLVHAEKEWTRQLFTQLLREAGVARAVTLGRQLALIHEGTIVELTAGGSAYALDDARAAMRALIGV